jgi:hypothetical protein
MAEELADRRPAARRPQHRASVVEPVQHPCLGELANVMLDRRVELDRAASDLLESGDRDQHLFHRRDVEKAVDSGRLSPVVNAAAGGAAVDDARRSRRDGGNLRDLARGNGAGEQGVDRLRQRTAPPYETGVSASSNARSATRNDSSAAGAPQ